MGIFRTNWEPAGSEETRRLRFLGLFFFILIIAVLFRAFTIQVWKREPWNNLAPSQYQRRIKLVAKRGTIYDRNLDILAMDHPVLSLAVDPTQVQDIEEVASTLVKELGGEKESYRKLLSREGNKSFVRIKREITEEQKNTLFEKKHEGLILIQGRKRVRPYESLALQVLGITDGMHRGVGGIEQALEGVLRGEDGWAVLQKDGLNRKFLSLDYPVEQSKDGNHVVLTLDQVYQMIVEEELKKGIVHHRAKSGSGILMNPHTGEILAMASGIGDRLRGEAFDFAKLMKNRAVQVDFEPGSSFKIVTAAAAMEEGVYQPSTLIYCENGTYPILGHTIHDHSRAYTWLTLSQILENSSNIGIVKVGRELGKEVLYKYMQNFGFGNRTGIQLPGEAIGILRPVYRWTDFSIASISFGQEVSVTGLQLACMISVIANGGYLVKPRILRGILDDQGNEIKHFSTKIIRRVVSDKTADKLKNILEDVIRNGSGTKAQVEGVRIAGKTGTAQKSVPDFEGYLPGAYVSSFIGFWPVESPLFVLVIVLDEAKENYWGAQSAAPIFARIVSRMTGLPNSLWLPDDAEKEIRNKRLAFSNFREKDHRESMNTEKEPMMIHPSYLMPRLVGMSIREALQKLPDRGMEVRIEGNGVIVEQEPKPGQRVEAGTLCRLICYKMGKGSVLQ